MRLEEHFSRGAACANSPGWSVAQPWGVDVAQGLHPDALNIFFSLEWWGVIGLVTLWLEGNFFVGAAKDLVD
jgi:hypothetical protein